MKLTRQIELAILLFVIAASSVSLCLSILIWNRNRNDTMDCRTAILENVKHQKIVYVLMSDGKGKTMSKQVFFASNGEQRDEEVLSPGQLP